LPQGFKQDSQIIALICPKPMMAVTTVIGTSPKLNITHQIAPTGETPVSTKINTDLLGDKMVITNKIKEVISQDEILKTIF
jgi:hypothetical protein